MGGPQLFKSRVGHASDLSKFQHKTVRS
jgi:hypothetical protein